MDGLIIRLLDDKTGAPGRWFWKVFGPIRPDLDRMFWCFGNQPWMGFPSHDLAELDRFEADHIEPFEETCQTSIQLWRPGTLGRFAGEFGEEFIELWAIEPTRDDPARLAEEWSRRNWNQDVIRRHARVWLLYTDSTCWEICARKPDLLNRVRAGLDGKAWAKVHRSHSERRPQSFGDAGLAGLWRAFGV